MAIKISKKNIKINNLYGEEFKNKYGYPAPIGVQGRNSDNTLFEQNKGWKPNQPLIDGMFCTYKWIETQINKIN